MCGRIKTGITVFIQIALRGDTRSILWMTPYISNTKGITPAIADIKNDGLVDVVFLEQMEKSTDYTELGDDLAYTSNEQYLHLWSRRCI